MSNRNNTVGHVTLPRTNFYVLKFKTGLGSSPLFKLSHFDGSVDDNKKHLLWKSETREHYEFFM